MLSTNCSYPSLFFLSANYTGHLIELAVGKVKEIAWVQNLIELISICSREFGTGYGLRECEEMAIACGKNTNILYLLEEYEHI